MLKKTFCPHGDKKEDIYSVYYDTVQEVLSMIQRGDTKANIIDKVQEIERIALNKVWGVMLPPDGQTIRLKKKELF